MLRRVVLLVLAMSACGCSLLLLGDGEYTGGGRGDFDGGGPTGDADGPGDASASPDVAGGDDADAATSRYASVVLADGPILYLRFGESSGSTAKALVGRDGRYDVSGIVLGQPGAIAGDPDTAFTFTESDARILVPSSGASFDGNAPFSVEVWAKPTQENTDFGFLLDHTEWGAERRGWSLLAGSSGTRVERWATTQLRSGVTVPPASLEAWHHVAATYDGDAIHLYVDGVLIGSNPSALALPSRTSTLTIGRQGCDCGGGFVGSLDELAVYDKALTEDRIAAHYAAAR